MHQFDGRVRDGGARQARLCFGASFYTSHRQITRATREDFAARLAEAIARGDDPAGGRELRLAVLRCYEAPGDVLRAADEDLRRTAAIVLQHLGAVRRRTDRFGSGRSERVVTPPMDADDQAAEGLGVGAPEAIGR